MTWQDLHRHPDILSNPEYQLNQVSGNSYFLDSPDIITADHVVRVSKTYILFDYVQGKLSSASPVVLKAVLDVDGEVHVFLVDMLTQKQISRKLPTGNQVSKLQWKLCDLDILINTNNLDVIEDHVKAGDDSELLEFLF